MKLNWQKEEQYDYVNALDYHALAFEFLRRNKSYKADYNEYLAILNEVEKDKDPESENWTKQDTRLWVLSPEIEEHETLDDWRKRVYLSNVDPIEKPLHIAYGEKWGLRNAFPNPASPNIS